MFNLSRDDQGSWFKPIIYFERFCVLFLGAKSKAKKPCLIFTRHSARFWIFSAKNYLQSERAIYIHDNGVSKHIPFYWFPSTARANALLQPHICVDLWINRSLIVRPHIFSVVVWSDPLDFFLQRIKFICVKKWGETTFSLRHHCSCFQSYHMLCSDTWKTSSDLTIWALRMILSFFPQFSPQIISLTTTWYISPTNHLYFPTLIIITFKNT